MGNLNVSRNSIKFLSAVSGTNKKKEKSISAESLSSSSTASK